MISKWKYNYTDEEKGMALTIQNLKQEIDKLVDTNEDINREFSQYKYESKKEIEKLNNIINELEKELDKEYDTYITKNVIYGKTFKAGANVFREHIKYRLQELKGSDKD